MCAYIFVLQISILLDNIFGRYIHNWFMIFQQVQCCAMLSLTNSSLDLLYIFQACMYININLNSIYQGTVPWPLYICTFIKWTLVYWEQQTHTHNLRSAMLLNGGLWTVPLVMMLTEHQSLPRHGSLTPIYLYIHKMNFSVLRGRNSYPQLEVNHAQCEVTQLCLLTLGTGSWNIDIRLSLVS